MSIDFFSAFIIGLLGSGHCLGMCGGITTMLTSALKKPKISEPRSDTANFDTANTDQSSHGKASTTQIDSHKTKVSTHGDISVKLSDEELNCSPPTPKLSLVLCYHIGRVASYCLIGAIVGYTGSIAAKNIGLPIAGLRLIAAVFLILLGLYIGQWLLWLTKVENLGKRLWRFISPMAKFVIPVDNSAKALGLGALWGWLPCGLVYSTMTWSLASGSATTGAAIMLFFGLGTVPALVAVSLGTISIKKLLINTVFRKGIALLLIAYGIYSFVVAYQLMF